MNRRYPTVKAGEGSNQPINVNISFNKGAISGNNININLSPDLLSQRNNEMPSEEPTLPVELCTEEAMALWSKVQEAGYINENYQPKISRTLSAILADEMAVRLNILDKWKTFEGLWNRRNMYRDYYKALNQEQTLKFQEDIKHIFK